MAPENSTTSLSEILERKARSARQQAYEEELVRLQKEVDFRGRELRTRWLAKEQEERQQELNQAHAERSNQERSLKNREQEFLRQIEEEERRKADEYQRRKEDEKRRKREEEERKRKQEEEQLAAVQRQAEIGDLTPKQVEQLRKAKKFLAAADTRILNRDYEGALVEVSKALSLVPTMPEAIEMKDLIRQSIREAKEAEDKAKAAEESSDIPQEPVPPRKASPAKGIFIFIVLVVIIIIGVALLKRQKNAMPERISIAVLPWNYSSAGGEFGYFGYTYPQHLAALLRSNPSLRVMGYASSSAIAERAKDPAAEIASLGFSDFLTGSMKNDNGKLTINLRLVDTSGTEKWKQTFESQVEAVSNLDSEIVKQLFGVLSPRERSVRLSPGEKQGSSNAEALASYLQGIKVFHQGSEDHIESALAFFRQSSTQDSNYIEPLVATASLLLSDIERNGDHDNSLATAEQLVQKALYLNSTNTDAIVGRARIRTMKGDFAAALKELDEALHVQPDMSEALLQKCRIQIETGDYGEAATVLKQALSIDPKNPGILRYAGYVQQLNGQYHQGMLYHDLAVQLTSDSIEYLTGPIADCILFDPDLSTSYENRLVRALKNRLDKNPADYEAMYRLGRLEQLSGVSGAWQPMLSDLSARLKKELGGSRSDEGMLDVELALALTRLGNYAEATRYASLATSKEQFDPRVFYKAAQVYSVQMFSYKKDQVDSTKRSLALEALRKAVLMDFRIDEIISGDFFNFRKDADFKKTIQLPMK
jgi:TolB-like protein